MNAPSLTVRDVAAIHRCVTELRARTGLNITALLTADGYTLTLSPDRRDGILVNETKPEAAGDG